MPRKRNLRSLETASLRASQFYFEVTWHTPRDTFQWVFLTNTHIGRDVLLALYPKRRSLLEVTDES